MPLFASEFAFLKNISKMGDFVTLVELTIFIAVNCNYDLRHIIGNVLILLS